MSTPRFDIISTPLGDRQLLLEASAGTGKTFALTGLVVRLLLEGVDLKKVLVVTFTNAATDELKTRIRSRLRDTLAAFCHADRVHDEIALRFVEQYGSEPLARRAAVGRLETALLDVDEASVFTIHGFCQRVLQQSAFESGTTFEPEFVEDADDLFDRAMADFLARRTHVNLWMARLAGDLHEGELRTHYRTFYRYPDVRIEPDAPTLDAAVADLEAAADALREVWPRRRGTAAELLHDIRWKKASGLQGMAESVIDRLDADLADAPHDVLDVVSVLAANDLPGCAYKSTPAEKLRLVECEPAFQACERVRDAFAIAQRSFLQAFLTEVHGRYAELKRTAGVLTFDDLLRDVEEALRPGSETRPRVLAAIRNRWTHALVDEFQDTDPLQYRIFHTAFAGRPLVFVGDPKQAIYSFRGADVHAYLRARENGDADARFVLGKNWRSTTALVEAVNALFAQAQRPFLLENVAYEPVEPAGAADDSSLSGDGRPPMVWWTLHGDDEPLAKKAATPHVVKGVAAGIRQVLSGGMKIDEEPVSPADIAVLVRTNAEGADIQQALREAEIPSVVSKSGDIWSASEVVDLEHLLRAFLQPGHRTAACSALATDLWGRQAAEVQAVRQNEEAMEEIRAALTAYRTTWRHQGILHALTQFIENEDVTGRLLKLIDGERRLTNLRHAMELLHAEETRHNRGPDELVQWLRTRESRRGQDGETAELRLESDADAVQIVTVHKSKGLQYNIVIAPFLWSAQRTHSASANLLVHEGSDLVYDVGSDRHAERRHLADAERLAEDLRLAYVALTRAVHRCYVVWGNVNQSECSALAYLLHGHAVDAESDLAGRTALAFEAGSSEHVASSLDHLARSHPSLMTIEPLPTAGPSVPRSAAIGGAFAPRDLSEDAGERLHPWNITSYSRLASGDPHEPAFSWRSNEHHADFFAFATGRVAGSCLHEIIEEVDLRALSSLAGPNEASDGHVADGPAIAGIERLIGRKLRAFGLDRPTVHRGETDFDPHYEVLHLLRRLGNVQLPMAGTTLSEVDAGRVLREWSFMVPVDAIRPGALADAVARHADEPIRSTYPAQLRRLEHDALEGYLTGIADLAFEHEDRWYVLDWKSTFLGSEWHDYAPDRLLDSALDRHYVLQLLLYALGMHRYLKTRRPDYDYDRHMGGAGVVFLRGVDGRSENGFLTLRPPRALIEAMEAMLHPVPL